MAKRIPGVQLRIRDEKSMPESPRMELFLQRSGAEVIVMGIDVNGDSWRLIGFSA